MKPFICQIVAATSFHLPEGLEVKWEGLPGPFGPTRLRLETAYKNIGLDQPIPQALVIDVHTDAEELEDAIGAGLKMAEIILPGIAFAANAASEDPQLVLAYDVDPNADAHDFVQSFVRIQDDAILTGSRQVDHELMFRVVDAMFTHPKSERIHRAMVHYGQALSHWRCDRGTEAG